MPVYEYVRADCGPFEAIEHMSNCSEPTSCSDCGAQAPRVMLTAPNLSFVSQSTRISHLSNGLRNHGGFS